MTDPSRYAKSLALFERAARVIPGGIYGHKQPAFGLPGRAPYWVARAEGARFWDPDGHEYIDYLCGFGPVVLGHAHPEVDAAARQELTRGTCTNMPGEPMVRLAERLVERIDLADWAVMAKNGGDVTTWAVRVAQEHTGRDKIVRARGAYHGVDAWCSTHPGGVTPDMQKQVLRMRWNHLEDLEAAAQEHPGRIAAVILTPYHHPTYGPQQMPDEGFWDGVRRVCDREGIVLILDDVRVGFRLHLGGSHLVFGIAPDLVTYSKALANGHPIAAMVGRDTMRPAVERVFMSGTYWFSSAPMAAAMTTLDILQRDDVPARLDALGERLRKGLLEVTRRHDVAASVTGPSVAPYLTFDEDPHLFTVQELCAELMARGIYLHPHHHAFLCAAHTEADIDRTIEACDEALPLALERAHTVIRDWPPA